MKKSELSTATSTTKKTLSRRGKLEPTNTKVLSRCTLFMQGLFAHVSADVLFKSGVLGLLLVIVVLGFSILNQLSLLHTQQLLQYGGVSNYARLKGLYASAAYTKYFENEISLLEKRVSQFQEVTADQ